MISTVVEILRQRATQHPTQLAYTFLLDGETEEVHLNYKQLAQRAQAIGAQLQSLGTLGERALLLYPPGLEYVAGFLGCLYAGFVAVPAYPPDPLRLNRTLPRLKAIVNDANPSVLLTTSPILLMAQAMLGQDPDFQRMQWLASDEVADDTAAQWQDPGLDGQTLAFLQYTSGSTAAPKGVMLTHDNLLHNSALISEGFGVTSESRGMIWLPPYHDMGLIGGIIQPLYAGIPVTLISPVDFLKRPLRWLQAISHYNATISGGPNFAYDLCARKITPEERAALDLSSWELAFNGAEPVRYETMERFAQTFAPCGFRKEAFYPCYGLAEATLIVSGGKNTALPITQTFNGTALKQNRAEIISPAHPEAQNLVGCGHSLADQTIVIVDPDTSRRCAPGQIGEIWVSGPSVAGGYWNRPEETAQTLKACLKDGDEGPFLRTGDLGFLHKGELFVTGRSKDLIIIRGQNHYPQDIEQSVEKSHPGLRPGCGAAFSVDVAGEERLVIAQEVRRRVPESDWDEIIQIIRQAVTHGHEIQTYGVLLLKERSIPKTSSGKIQRHACKAGFLSDSLEVVAQSILEVTPAETPTGQPEESFIRKALEAVTEPTARHSLLTLYLQEQTARVLRVPPSQVAIHNSLGTLGLDSLMAIELKHEIETSLGITLPMTSFLQEPNIAQIATDILAQLTTPDATLDKIAFASATEAETEHPLSYGQQSLWFLYQLAPESAAYNVPSAVRIRSHLDVPALKRALDRLVTRHPVLRTTYHSSSKEPVQRVHERMDIDFQILDAATWGQDALHERLSEEAHQPFDLENGPLLHARVFKRSDEDYILLLAMHHITTDFWSLGVLVEELSVLYPAECTGEVVTLSPLNVQYTDYARWEAEMLAGPRGKELQAYWLEQLAGELPVLNLPTDYSRPPVQTYNGSVHTVRLSADLAERIKSLAREQGTTMYTILQAAFQVLLHRYTGQQDILLGSLSAGRNRAELAGIMGYFVNPIVIRSRPSPTQSFVDFLAQTRQLVFQAFEHQEYPFNILVDQLQIVRDYSRSPLFQVMFVFQRAHRLDEQGLTPFALDISGAEMELAGLHLESLALEHKVAQFDLTLTMGEAEGELVASFEYNTDLFKANTVARVATHLETLLQGIVADPHQRLTDLPLLTETEQHQLLVEWNGVFVDQPSDLTVQTMFEAQAARTPDAIAVLSGDKHLTYQKLDRQASQLATYLQMLELNESENHMPDLGAGPEIYIGVCIERSLEMIIGILSILKAGYAYVPLDPAHPQDRLAIMLAETQAPVLLTQNHLQDSLPWHGAQVFCLDTGWQEIEAYAQTHTTSPKSETMAQKLACAIYTSGSTGWPKGILLENRGIVNLIHSFIDSYNPTPRDRILPVTSIASASFVGEILPILCAGGTLVLPSEEESLDLDRLFDLMARCQVSIVSTVPAVIVGLNQRKDDIPPLRWLLSGGEALDISDIDALQNRVTVVNSYGLTETTVCSTFYKPHDQEMHVGGVPIGRPIRNTGVYVLDNDLNCLPIGFPGELYISGAGLARGYLCNVRLTAERFLPNPYRAGERMYRTGDLVRWLPGGNLEYLQRIDHQVQIHGFRIELKEIEATLRQHPDVRDAVVVASEDTPDNKKLVAYIIPTDTDTELTSQTLYGWMVDKVPLYMVPSFFEMLDALPLTASGKVDQRALPMPKDIQPGTGQSYVTPRSELERTLASIWREVLKIGKVGLYDNLFELGGNSLLIAQVHQRLRKELNSDLSLIDMFKYPTISSLAQYLNQKQDKEPTLHRVKDEAQKRKKALQQRKQIVNQRVRRKIPSR